MWDITNQAVGGAACNKDQLENYWHNSIQHGWKACEETNKFVDEFITQLKNNQLYLQKMMEESVVEAVKNFDLPRLEDFEGLYKR